jgi:hypothetical protein
MRKAWTFSWVAALAVACGGGSGGGGRTPPPKFVAPDGPVLGRLTAGSTWTYQVTDPIQGTYQKQVVVLGPATLPGTGQATTQLRETAAGVETLAWHSDADGLFLKWREEERVGGLLTKTTDWAPGVMKYLSRAAPAGWTWQSDARETVTYPDGTKAVSDVSYVWTVVSASDRITVPAGTFDCVKVTKVNQDKVDKTKTYWFAAGVGKVREEGGQVEELASYDLK